MDELIDPKDEQLQLLEEERDQLLSDLKLTKELLKQQQQERPEPACAGAALGHLRQQTFVKVPVIPLGQLRKHPGIALGRQK